MRYQVLALLAVVASAAAQGVTDKIPPKGKAPAGCQSSIGGKFEVAIIPIAEVKKRDEVFQKRAACNNAGVLVTELNDGVLTDALGRTGYIASNFQFQFDQPPQAGSLYTAGFSSCANGSLALGDSTVFYQCKSGSFSNLYDRWWADQCSPVEVMIMKCGTGSDADQHNGVIVGTAMVATTMVMPLSDGQPQVITTKAPVPMCQISDGQVQGHTTPCASLPAATATYVPVSQYSDGQIQVTPIGSVAPPASVPPATGSPAVPTSAAGSVSVSVPTPPASGVPGNGTTFSTTATPSSGVIANPGGPPTTVPVAPSSGAGHIQTGSAAALVLGVLGAFWLL
ncbi:hypothetical protein B0H63DRAFT_194032 [Podospora didyma]|uniref:Cell wall mannoprotein PIR1-like C-terminal domain-containing protein n=1 Tax=Podospora didyma TaxID=330526 RepID=A0AAE0TV73_9PEZI|nr:hypothetical protein B0H63DRAFT_194032 [Podospora didyma]